MKIITPLLILLGLTTAANAATEREVQAVLCQGKQIEVTLSTGARADCVDDRGDSPAACDGFTGSYSSGTAYW